MITVVVLNPAVDKVYMIDNFQAGKLFRADSIVKSAGGKGINVARVASLLGEEVSSIGFKAGGTGEWLEASLKSLGVTTSFIKVDGESRTNNNIIDKARGMETEILEAGPVIEACAIQELASVYKEKLKNTKILVCTGSLPVGVEDTFYRKLIETANYFGVKTVLDASGNILREGIEAKPWLVKPNLRELCGYVGQELEEIKDIMGACRAILEKGVKAVAVSMGRKGALWVSKDSILLAEVPQINVVNTIGSGDSMVAGIAAGVSRGMADEEAFRLGVACSVSNTQFAGIGMIETGMVNKLLTEIKLEKLTGGRQDG